MKLPHRTLSRRANKRGFTLVEIGLVVLIIGLLAVLAMPAITASRRASRAARFINDARTAGQMFAVEALNSGVYPDSSGPGVVPVGMEDALARSSWTSATAAGGQWKWVLNEDPAFYAGVVVDSPTEDRNFFLKIDQRIDDGDLSTGNFQEYGSGYVYIVE